MDKARQRLNRAARRAHKVASLQVAFYWVAGAFLLFLLCAFGAVVLYVLA